MLLLLKCQTLLTFLVKNPPKKMVMFFSLLLYEITPIGENHFFSKIAVTLEPVMRFDVLWDLESLKNCNLVYFMTGSIISNRWGVAAP